MKQQAVLVTGANSGFGKLIALTFARSGYHVYATTRNLESESVKENPELEWLILDVTNQVQIDDAFKFIEKKGLDILVNNAGFGILGPIEEFTTEDFQKQFDTNFFGVVRMVYKFLPLLKKSNSPKIITISSIAGLIVAPSYGLYASSKHAVEVFIEALSYELFDTNIKISLVEPGGFDTNFSANSKGLNSNNKNLESAKLWYKNAIKIRSRHIGAENNIISKKRDPQRVADLILKIARSKNPRLRYIIGQGAFISHFLRKILPGFVWEWAMKTVLRRLSVVK